MTDIVEQLRKMMIPAIGGWTDLSLIEKAANEIERLRAEVKTNNDEASRAWAMVQDKQAEIKRLQAVNEDLEGQNDNLRRINAGTERQRRDAMAEITRLQTMTNTSIKDQIIASHIDDFKKQNAEIERLARLLAETLFDLAEARMKELEAEVKKHV